MPASDPDPTITLYSYPSSRGARIAWLMEEIGLSYEVINGPNASTDGSTNQEFKESTRALGRVPTLHDTVTDDNGQQEDIIVCESGAVAEYLLHRYSKLSACLLPQTPISRRTKVVQYVHMAEGTFFYHAAPITINARFLPAILECDLFADISSEKKTVFVDLATRYSRMKLMEDMDWLEQELQIQAALLDRGKPSGVGEGLYLVGGHFTLADLMMGWAVDNLFDCILPGQFREEKKTRWVFIKEWLKGLKSRPAWSKAREKTG